MDNKQLTQSFQTALKNLKSKIIKRGNLSHVSVEDQLSYINELYQFPLGQVLLGKKSIDTFWTDFIITYLGQKGRTNLEDFILNRSPFILAWRELAENFQKIIQENLKDGMTLASIPCGAMRELLQLDYSYISNFRIIGIDIDPDSLFLAQQLGEKRGLTQHLNICQYDAWQLPYNSEIDLIASCGLNIYISNRQKVLDLYRQFVRALKPEGKLIIGFLTYPPGENMPSEWHLDEIAPKDLFLETVLYKNILDLQWRNFRTSNEFESELREVGFSQVTFHYDRLHVFPTVVAEK